MMNLLRTWIKRKQLKKEIERLGVIALANTLETDQEKRKFIFQYYLGGM
jgi:hypothetical protein